MRSAQVTRNTLETKISVQMNLDGNGKATFDTGLPFLDHMLDQVARHGMVDLEILAKGHAYVPLDEALSRVVLDISGRPGLVFHVDFVRSNVGDFDVDLVREFFQGFVNHALVTLHIDNLAGDNAHHQAETIFKAFGRALRMALEIDPRMAGMTPSTKGTL